MEVVEKYISSALNTLGVWVTIHRSVQLQRIGQSLWKQPNVYITSYQPSCKRCWRCDWTLWTLQSCIRALMTTLYLKDTSVQLLHWLTQWAHRKQPEVSSLQLKCFKCFPDNDRNREWVCWLYGCVQGKRLDTACVFMATELLALLSTFRFVRAYSQHLYRVKKHAKCYFKG